jgi:hypothetical protein
MPPGAKILLLLRYLLMLVLRLRREKHTPRRETQRPFDCLCHEQRRFRAGQGPVANRKKLPPGLPIHGSLTFAM